MTGGRISVLVSRDFQALLTVLRGLDTEVRSQIRAQTKRVILPIWQEEVRGRVTTRLQSRVLLDTARVSVSDTQVILKSAMVGKTAGVPNTALAPGAEFGAAASTTIRQRSAKGTPYTRRRGAVFLPPRKAGYVVYPASGEAIIRAAKLWAQTAYRTTAEQLEKVTR